MATTAGRLVVEVVGDVSGLINAYQEAQKQTETFEGQLKTIGDSLTKTGQKLTLGVTTPLVLMGGLSVHTAATFDDSMRQVQAVTGATADQFERLRQMAIELGASTAWSASQVADAQKYLAKAGLDVNQVLEATPQMLSLASAGTLNLASAADIATNVLSGYNLEVSDLAHVSDMLAQASSTANTDVQQMGEAMAYVGPVASASNQQIEMTAATIQIMSNAGIQGSMAGTSLRGSLSALLTPTTDAKNILAEYGLTAKDVDPQIHSLSEIVGTLGDVGLTTADAMTIFGDRAGPGMIALIAAGQDQLDDYTAALEDCDGVAEQMAETMESGVGGRLRELEGQVETLQITFGDLIAEALLPAAETLGDVANWLSSLDEGTQQTIVTMGIFAAAVGPATWAIGSMAGGVSNMISLYRTYQASTIAATVATKGFTAAIASNPIGLAVIGLTSLAAILIPVISHTEDAADAQEKYNELLAETADLSEKTQEELEAEIEELILKREEIEKQIEQIDSYQTPAIEESSRALARNTEETTFGKIASGEFGQQVQQTVRDINDETYALERNTQAMQDSVRAGLEDERVKTEVGITTRQLEIFTRQLSEGAEEAYQQATKSVNAYRDSVADLQDQYDDLKDTIDRALNIDEEVDDATDAIERAQIALERTQISSDDLQEEIEDLQKSMKGLTGEELEAAQATLTDLLLDQRSSVLDLKDARDDLKDAQDEYNDTLQERSDLEEELNGESIESAQDRLEQIGEALDDETEKLKAAQDAQTEAKIAYENLTNQIDLEALQTKSENWAAYVKYIAENPALAKTYFIEYDALGNASYTPVTEIPSIALPEYASLNLSGVSSGNTTNNNNSKSVSVTINQTVNTATASATEVQNATRKGVRDVVAELGL